MAVHGNVRKTGFNTLTFNGLGGNLLDASKLRKRGGVEFDSRLLHHFSLAVQRRAKADQSFPLQDYGLACQPSHITTQDAPETCKHA
jgi:hypothetical protein